LTLGLIAVSQDAVAEAERTAERMAVWEPMDYYTPAYVAFASVGLISLCDLTLRSSTTEGLDRRKKMNHYSFSYAEGQ